MIDKGLSDSKLVSLYQNGNEEAFEMLLHRHKSKVYTAIYLIVKDRYTAEDLLQETFVKAINTIRNGNGALDLERVEQHFAARCRECVRIPWDPHLDAGAEATLDALRPETRNAYLELAAAVAAGFGDPIERRS